MRERTKEGKKDLKSAPVYATDVPGILMSSQIERWNINNFKHPDSLIHGMEPENWLAGVYTSYLYIGTQGTVFSFHVEDYNLNSISFNHYGAPKVWYGIPESYSAEFEKFCKGAFPKIYKGCSAPLRHKTLLVDRATLHKAKFRVYEAFHCEGMFIITWGGAYHGGFNIGFNIAEASNFASPEWRKVGRTYQDCKCL